MLDIGVSFNRYKFLGFEFLTWLWYIIENENNILKAIDPELESFQIGNRVVCENKIDNNVESIIIKGDDADLKEGILSLRKGSLVIEINLFYKTNINKFRFTLKGDTLNIVNIKIPETGVIETKNDIEGALLEKIFLYEKIIYFIDNLYKNFLQLRISDDWLNKIVPQMKNWIYK